MRYERKYRIAGLDKSLIIRNLLLHPAGLKPLFEERQVNNIYLDSIGFASYHDNVNGNLFRKKYRVRWYGDNLSEAVNPIFEVKIKENELGYKQSKKIDNFKISQMDNLTDNIFSNFPPAKKILHPVLCNSYKRLYFITPDKKFRLTLDYDLQYSSLLNGSFSGKHLYTENGICILEIKYEDEFEELAEEFFMHIPYQRTKNSKYVSGIQICYY